MSNQSPQSRPVGLWTVKLAFKKFKRPFSGVVEIIVVGFCISILRISDMRKSYTLLRETRSIGSIEFFNL